MTDEKRVSIADLVRDNPDLQTAIKEIKSEVAPEPQASQSPMPDGWKLEEKNEQKILDWWRKSEYAYVDLSYESLIRLYEETNKALPVSFRWKSSEQGIPTMSVTQLIMEGWVEDVCIISDSLQISVRSLPGREAQAMEFGASEFLGRNKQIGQRALSNYYTFEMLSNMIRLINNEPIEKLTRLRGVDLKEDKDLRYKFIEDSPGELIDLMRQICQEFSKRVTLMLKGGLSKN